MAGIFSLRNWVMKQLMKQDQSGIMKIPDKGKIDFGEMLVREQLFKKGINPGSIKNEKQLNNILDTPAVPKSERVKPKKSADIIEVDFDKGRWNKAQGGKTGLSYLLAEDTNERVPFKMGRRAFLKLMGGVGAGIGALKTGLLKLTGKEGATVAKELTSVPIKNVDGMPAWFKPLVNKVIKEGDDVTKQWATQERQIVHKTKLPESQTDVLVHQDLDSGDVWVDIGIEKHGFASGKYGQPVRLEYKAAEEVEPVINSWTGKVDTKGRKTPEEFNVEEAEFTGGHPENVKFEEVSVNKFGKHESDFSEVEAFAKGKTKKGSRKVSESFDKMNEDIADRFSNYPRPDDYASGGIAKILGE